MACEAEQAAVTAAEAAIVVATAKKIAADRSATGRTGGTDSGTTGVDAVPVGWTIGSTRERAARCVAGQLFNPCVNHSEN